MKSTHRVLWILAEPEAVFQSGVLREQAALLRKVRVPPRTVSLVIAQTTRSIKVADWSPALLLYRYDSKTTIYLKLAPPRGIPLE